VLFSHPVSKDQLRAHLSVSPSLPLSIQTEYCYAVLKGDFKPNLSYTVYIQAGLRSVDGETMDQPVTQTVYLRDAAPRVRFADRGRLIPLGADPIVAVKTTNLDDYRYDVHKVFRNNLVSFLKGSRRDYRSARYYRDEEEYDDGGDGDYRYNYEVDEWSTDGLGASVANGAVTVDGGRINEEVETTLNFAKWQSAPWKGLFTVEVRDQQGGSRDSRWFLATDLGLLAKRAGDDLWVQVLSLSKVLAQEGVRLSLVSDTNQVIEEQVTDSSGRAWFKNWKNNPYKFRPLVVVAERQGDWSFLRLDQGELNSSRFDVSGDAFSTSGWDGFLTSDRGLYRPGDTVHFTGVVRQADLSTPQDLPVRLKVWDTGGTEIARLPAKLSGDGMAVFKFPLRGDLTTGTYSATLELETGTALARTDFKMEEFIPNKIKAEVLPRAKMAAAGEQLVFDVKVQHLFGAPASKLKVRSHVLLRDAVFKSKRWEGDRFSDDSRGFQGETLQVPDGETDDRGVYSAQLPIPLTVLPASMLEAVVYAEAFDTGGRPVGASSVVDVHRYPFYLGLKSKAGRQVSPGQKVALNYVAVTPAGKPVKVGTSQLIVKRKVWYSVFRRSGWSGRGYESSYYEETVLGKEIQVDGEGIYRFTPDKPGEYTVYLGNSESMRTSLTFVAVGLGSSPDEAQGAPTNLEAPERQSLSLSKKSYEPGEAPQLEVRAPFAGTLVVTVEREKVFSTRSFHVPAGLSVVDLPAVGNEHFPNAYVVGVLVRPPLESLRELPGVSFGVVPLVMDLKSREVALNWDAPKSVKSREGISLTLNTGAPGSKVVLAAVDEGILQIINFKTPDPFHHFYRKRGLTTETISLFDDVLPQLDRKNAVGGGDDSPAFASRHLNPVAAKRVKSYAQFSGILTADAKGNITFRFPTDQFHGEVRVMALAVEGRKFGASSYSVNVADPIVVEPSFPRFLAPLDLFDVPVLIYNKRETKQDLTVELQVEGPAHVDGDSIQKLTLPARGQKRLIFHAKAKNNAGKANFKVVAKDSEGEAYDVETELAVRPGNPLTTEVHYGELGSAKETTLKVPGGFIPQGQRMRLVTSSSPLLTFLRSLDYLLSYPYGCTEQVTSQAFPLLSFGDVGLLTGRFSGRAGELQRFVQSAVDEVQARQLEDGSFAPWPSSTRRNDYLSNYASHFLIEAKRKGYDVKAETLSRIKKRIGAIEVFQKGGRLDRRKANTYVADSTYVLFLKTLVGTPDLEMMNRFKNEHGHDFYLSLAFSEIQDRGSALEVLPTVKLPDGIQRKFWDDWFSPNKHAALYLLCLTRADPTSPKIRELVLEFGKRMKNGHFGTTHDNAWVFMALGEAVKTFGKYSPLDAVWKVQGGVEKPLKGETDSVVDRELSGHEVVVKNNGSLPMYYHLMAEGTRLESGKDTVSNGLSVSREYRDENGKTVNLDSVAQGELVVVTLKINCSKQLDNLVVVDLLPGGFEVDNPRLASRGRLGFDPPCSFNPAYQDFRDDRVILFSEQVDGDLEFSYSVRAVTPGKFLVPGLLAEAMYDPEIYGRYHENQTLNVAPLQ
jgi:alpha-2-macroglobulin